MTKEKIEEHIRQQVRNLFLFGEDHDWVADIIDDELDNELIRTKQEKQK